MLYTLICVFKSVGCLMDISVFEIFPQSMTPPEPAPPDTGVMNKNSQMVASSSSIDEITCIKNKNFQNVQCGLPFIIFFLYIFI